MSKKFFQFFLNYFKSVHTSLAPIYISQEIRLIKNSNKAFTKEPP